MRSLAEPVPWQPRSTHFTSCAQNVLLREEDTIWSPPLATERTSVTATWLPRRLEKAGAPNAYPLSPKLNLERISHVPSSCLPLIFL